MGHEMNSIHHNLVAKEVRNLVPYIKPPVPNPAPLGLFAFSLTTALLMVAHTGLGGESPEDARGVTNLVWGFAMFYGGFLQIVAGIHEFRRNNVLGYTAFLSYGGFWLSLGLAEIIMLMTPNTDVVVTGFNYKGKQTMLVLWGLLTYVFWICSFSVNMTICSLFFLLMCTFFLLAGGVVSARCDKVAGWVGMLTALNAFWLASVELVNDIIGKGNVVIPLGSFKKNPFKFAGGFHVPGRIHGVTPESSVYSTQLGGSDTPTATKSKKKVHQDLNADEHNEDLEAADNN